MFNGFYKYLVDERIRYSKRFSFQKCHSAKHAIAQLADKVYESFENNDYPLGY